MTETMSFLPKREQKVVVILLANNVIEVGEGLVSSLSGACWWVTSVQLQSLGLQCEQNLPLTCPPSVLTQKVRNSLLPHRFLFLSAVSPVWSPQLHPSAAQLFGQELSFGCLSSTEPV